MRSSNLSTGRQAYELGDLLRYWRGVRGKSQLDLSLDTGVSQRHISFIESGRSAPRRQMVIDLAQALEVPLRERNTILLAAGYSPEYSEEKWNTPEMARIRKALERMLRQHEPYPAIVMDRYWNILFTNKSAPRFFNLFVKLTSNTAPRNVLHMMFDPNGIRPYVEDWEDVAKGLLQRVYRETVGHVIDEKTKQLLDELQKYPGVEAAWKLSGSMSASPVIYFSFAKGDRRLRCFSMVTTVGLPQSITAQEFRIESMFPADDETEEFLKKAWPDSREN